MGFAEQLQEIIARLPDCHQTVLFSATLPKLLVEFARAGEDLGQVALGTGTVPQPGQAQHWENPAGLMLGQAGVPSRTPLSDPCPVCHHRPH